jgi:hypothetical protein
MEYNAYSRLTQMKQDFIQTWPMIYDDEDLLIAATNRVALVLEFSGVELYPAFQLNENRKTYPAIKELLKRADVKQIEDWSLAFWLTTPSAHDIFKRKPLDFIQNTEQVLKAFDKELAS